MRPEVSVIMATFDALPELTQAVDSIRGQTLGLDRIEFIAVDDCSTDGTYEELLRLADDWPGMLVLRTEENSGSGGTPRNLGLERFTGRYVFILDADDYLSPDALERMVDYADENEAEVLLPRMEGVGDRQAPRSMFRRSQASADLFGSRIYWNLGGTKLLSADLIRRTGIRFVDGLPIGAEQPFIARAYFAAKRISVLADRPYYFVRNRPDRSNVSLSVGAAPRLRTLRIMLALLEEHLPPGQRRDFLLRRHFDVDVMMDLRAAHPLQDHERDAVLDSLAELTRPHYADSISTALSPACRLCVHLLHAGRYPELYEVLAAKDDGSRPEILAEDGHAYELWPFFREPTLDIPDSCYDMTAWLRPRARLSAISWKGPVLELSGRAYIERLGGSPSNTSIVLRKRDIGTELIFPTEATAAPHRDPAGDDGAPDRTAASFSARIDVQTAENEGLLTDGLWDIYARLEQEGLLLETRLGGNRDHDVDSDHWLRLVHGTSDVSVATVYHTMNFGNITLDVGEASKRIEFGETTARWSADTSSAIEVSGSVNVIGVRDGDISIRLSGEDGTVYETEAAISDDEGTTEFFATVPVRKAAGGGALPTGDWRLSAHLYVGHVDRTGSVSCAPKLKAIRWWNGVRPMHAKLLPAEEGAVLRVRPVNLTRAAARRARALSRGDQT